MTAVTPHVHLAVTVAGIHLHNLPAAVRPVLGTQQCTVRSAGLSADLEPQTWAEQLSSQQSMRASSSTTGTRPQATWEA